MRSWVLVGLVAMLGAASCGVDSPIEAERSDRSLPSWADVLDMHRPTMPEQDEPPVTVPTEPEPDDPPVTLPAEPVPPADSDDEPSSGGSVALSGADDPRSELATVSGLLGRDPGDSWTDFPPLPARSGQADVELGTMVPTVLSSGDVRPAGTYHGIEPDGAGGALLFGALHDQDGTWRATYWGVDEEMYTTQPTTIGEQSVTSEAVTGVVVDDRTAVLGIEHRTPAEPAIVVWDSIGTIAEKNELAGGAGAFPAALVQADSGRLWAVATTPGAGGSVLVWSTPSVGADWSGPASWQGEWWFGATAVADGDDLIVQADGGWNNAYFARFAIDGGAPAFAADMSMEVGSWTADLIATPDGPVALISDIGEARLLRVTDDRLDVIDAATFEPPEQPLGLATLDGEVVVLHSRPQTPQYEVVDAVDVAITRGLEGPLVTDETISIGYWRTGLRRQFATVADGLLVADLANHHWATVLPQGSVRRRRHAAVSIRSPQEQVVASEMVGDELLTVVRTTDPFDEEPHLGDRVVVVAAGEVVDPGDRLAGDRVVAASYDGGVVIGVADGSQTDWFRADSPLALFAGRDEWIGSSPGIVSSLAMTSTGPLLSNVDGTAWSSADFAEWVQIADIRGWDDRRMVVHGVCADGHLAFAVGHATGGDSQSGRVMLRTGGVWAPVASLSAASKPTLDLPIRCSYAAGEFAAVYEEEGSPGSGNSAELFRGRITAEFDEGTGTIYGNVLEWIPDHMTWPIRATEFGPPLVAEEGAVVAATASGELDDTDGLVAVVLDREPVLTPVADHPGDQTVASVSWTDGGIVMGGSDGGLAVVWLPAG